MFVFKTIVSTVVVLEIMGFVAISLYSQSKSTSRTGMWISITLLACLVAMWG